MVRDEVQIYNLSALSFREALKSLRGVRAAARGDSYILVEPRLLRSTWKSLFLIALRRMAKKSPTLAQLTALEALIILKSTGHPREPLRAMARRKIGTKDLTPRSGHHPEVLLLFEQRAREVFAEGTPTRGTVEKLSRRYGAGKLPDDVWNAITSAPRRARAHRLMVWVLGHKDARSLQVVLTRARKLHDC